MKKKIHKIIPLILILLGGMLAAYPYISEYLFEHRVDSEINTYQNAVKTLDSEQYEQMLKDAVTYNTILPELQVQLTDPFTAMDGKVNDIVYEELLKLDDTGIMGYIDIPAISVYLPIYHGTSAEALERGIGHLEGTSLPVGGSSTHSVLTGHTGINQAKLFTDLTEMEIGDLFFVHILGNILAYQVYEISTVLPEDTEELLVKNDEDRITLVTCTPYGINTHRLFVHGKRIDYSEETYGQTVRAGKKESNSQWMASYRKAILIGITIAVVFFLILFLMDKVRRKGNLFKAAGMILITVGCLIFLMPEMMGCIQKIQTWTFVRTYEEEYGRNPSLVRVDMAENDGSSPVTVDFKSSDPMYQKMREYNQLIFSSGQDFSDPWNDEQSAEAINQLADGIFGYIEIPALEQTFALYIGATMEHMSKGVAVMEQTSFPIGGMNTNCVIAGHRGYNQNKTFLKHIENIKVGDKIYITNPWEKLTYKVESIDIVDPYDVEAVRIQEDRDMVTLLTCHPYASHGKYRYLVYCTRCDEKDRIDEGDAAMGSGKDADHIVASDGTVYLSSQYEIKKEVLFREFCIGLILFLLLLSVIRRAAGRKHRPHKRLGKEIKY